MDSKDRPTNCQHWGDCSNYGVRKELEQHDCSSLESFANSDVEPSLVDSQTVWIVIAVLVCGFLVVSAVAGWFPGVAA